MRASSIAPALEGRRVLVTGHTGFKGAWLSAWLLELGAEVAGLALDPPTEPSLFAQLGLAHRLDDARGDVRDPAAVEGTVERVRPQLLLHLAAQALVRPSYRAPAETFGTNVMGTVHVLDAVRRSGRPCAVVVVTSDKVYEESSPPAAHGEDDRLGGFDPYGASKGAAELAVASYRRAFFPPEGFAGHGVALASVRAGNVIGGGDWAEDRIVPDVVRALQAGEPVRLRHPRAVRPWQHVLDALSGYLWLSARMLEEGASGLAEAWNFGPDDGPELDVEALVRRAAAAWGAPPRIAAQEAGPREARHLTLATAKARTRLDWRPTWDVGRAVDETVAWYRAEDDPWSRTVDQIRRFTADARSAGRAWAGGVRAPA